MHDAGEGPEAFIPLRHIPEEWLEQKRAELLEFNSKDGLRKLTDEERDRLDAEPADVPMDTAESVQADATAEPIDLLPGEGWG